MKALRPLTTLCFITFLVVLTACAGSTPTLPPPTGTATRAPTPLPTAAATLTPAPPTATSTHTPTPTPVLATSAEEIIGIWHGSKRDNMYQKFNADGTCQAAFERAVLETDPNVECTYSFEGTHLVMTADAIRGIPPCPDTQFVYQVQLLGSRDTRQIEFIKVKDTCGPRINTMTGVHEWVP